MQTDTYYHIYNRANGSENLFRKSENYRYFLQQWEKYITPVAATLAYCLMPNHFHVLVHTRYESELILATSSSSTNLQGFRNLGGFSRSKIKDLKRLDEYSKIISQHFSNLFNSYTKAYNKMYDRKGSLFRPNFKKKEIDSDDYLTNIIIYIHHNPVHHGFTKKIESWPYSSYPLIIADKPTFIDRTNALDWFGSKDAFIRFHYQSITYQKELEQRFT